MVNNRETEMRQINAKKTQITLCRPSSGYKTGLKKTGVIMND